MNTAQESERHITGHFNALLPVGHQPNGGECVIANHAVQFRIH
jgi:hypothetical protein